jgi:hypothetical protein
LKGLKSRWPATNVATRTSRRDRAYGHELVSHMKRMIFSKCPRMWPDIGAPFGERDPFPTQSDGTKMETVLSIVSKYAPRSLSYCVSDYTKHARHWNGVISLTRVLYS